MLNPSIVYDAYPKVPVQEFIPELAFEFTDMPENAFHHFVLKAINKLARKGNVLRRTALIHTYPCITNYLLEPQDCMDVVAVMGIRNMCHPCGVTGVTRLTHAHVPCYMPCGTYSWFEHPNVIHITNTQREGQYQVEFSVAPTYDACEVDRILLDNYYEVVLDGARTDLYAMSNKPWSSLQRMEYYRQQFLGGISRAAVETLAGGQRGALRAKRPVMF